MIRLLYFLLLMLTVSSLLGQDKRDPFMGYYIGTQFKDYGASSDKTIHDFVYVFYKSPTNPDSIYRKPNDLESVNRMRFWFNPPDSTFDNQPATPMRKNYGYFYDQDSVYYTEYHIGGGGLRNHFWGKKFKEVSVHEVPAADLLQVSPNPAKEKLYISLLWGEMDNRYTLYNVAGKQIQSGEIQNQHISLEHLPQGLYVLQLEINDTPVIKRIMKQ